MTRPIVTVTLNPAIDRTVWVDQLLPGTTHRTAETRATFGGKGINVACVVARIGAPVIAMGLAGDDQAGPMEHYLESLGVQPRFIRMPGETRTNLKIIEQATGRLTEINGSGPNVTPDLVDALEGELLRVVEEQPAAAVVLAGSLPIGVDPSVYARWTETLRRTAPEVPVLADASDEALALLVRAAPFMVKPNRVEAADLTGRPIENAEDATAAALDIARRGPHSVLLSLGSLGAVAAWGSEARALPARPISPAPGLLHTTVGAGDAMVARVAVELAGLDGGPITAEAFFGMARHAVLEAEGQIGGSDLSAGPTAAPATATTAPAATAS